MNDNMKRICVESVSSHFEYLRNQSYVDQINKKQKVDEYFAGLREGLDIAERAFKSGNFDCYTDEEVRKNAVE